MTISNDLEVAVRRMRSLGYHPEEVEKCLGVSRTSQTRILAADPAKQRLAGTRSVPAARLQRRQLVAKLQVERTVCPSGQTPFAFPSLNAFKAVLKLRHQIKVSRWGVARDLRALGNRPYVRGSRPTPPYKARTHFAEYWIRRGKRAAARICFSDEHFVNINDHGTRLQWATCIEDVEPRIHQDTRNIPNFQFWAAFGKDWRSELFILPVKDEETGKGWRMNGERYCKECLTPAFAKVMKERNFIFMQDGARAHTSCVAKDHLDKLKIERIKNWPPRSPDLNPIEQVWALVNAKIQELCPLTMADLVDCTQKVWKAIPVETLNNFQASFLAKCKNVVKFEKGKEVVIVKRPLGRPPGSKNKKGTKASKGAQKPKKIKKNKK